MKVETTSTLSTDSQRAGERFFVTLREPLAAGGRVIAAKGAVVEGQIEEADKGGWFGGRARLVIRLTRLHTSDGEIIRISSDSVGRQGGGHRVAFLKHASAVLPAQTPLNFRLRSPVTVIEGQRGRLAAKSDG